MVAGDQIKPGMKIVDDQGRDGGIVDQVKDDLVMLKPESFCDDLDHFVSIAAVKSLDGNTVIVESGHAGTTEEVLEYLRDVRKELPEAPPIFGTSGHGTGQGGSGFGG